ncbi:MAG TPA: hypothetical protein DEB18_16475 [Leeuwenhoekiella sp.]|nr:hypothetical protein [Leeuwenhoekiella sp.]
MKITKDQLKKIIREAIMVEMAAKPQAKPTDMTVYADRPGWKSDYDERRGYFHRPPLGHEGSHELETLRQMGYTHGGTTFEQRIQEKLQTIEEKLNRLLAHVGIL